MSDIPDLTTRIGLLEHRVEAIRAALEETALRDDVRLVLNEHLIVSEEALKHARDRSAAAYELQRVEAIRRGAFANARRSPA